MLAGVAGGLGKYFEIDPTLIRIIFVLLTVFGGSGILIYIVLWVLIPDENSVGLKSEETIRKNTKEMRDRAKSFTEEFKISSKNSSKNWLGIVVIIFGLLFLFDNLGLLSFHLFWPLLLIAFGFLMLSKKK